MQDDPAKRARATNTEVATHRAARLFAKPYQDNLSKWTEQALHFECAMLEATRLYNCSLLA